jgi:hypothetical protein
VCLQAAGAECAGLEAGRAWRVLDSTKQHREIGGEGWSQRRQGEIPEGGGHGRSHEPLAIMRKEKGIR